MNRFIILIFLLLTACTTSSPYRTESGSICNYVAKNDCPQQSMTISHSANGNDYQLSFMEFDEQGAIYYPQTKNKILHNYKEIASSNDVLLITFFHGWNHNAKGSKNEDSDIVRFRQVLAKAADYHPTKKVLGVFVGWRGRSLKGYLNYLTFWGRKHTAHEIGQQGGVTKVLLELESMIKGGDNPNSKMVTIGHSFGGAALYSTLNLIMAERYIASRNQQNNMVEGFGDLVVLLNPAFEAIRYSSLFELAQDNCREYSEKQKPRLIILSSEADLPVSVIFKGGQFFNAVGEKHRVDESIQCTTAGVELKKINQFSADINAVGHYDPYLTHDLATRVDQKMLTSFSSSKDISEGWSNSLKLGSVPFAKTILTSRQISQEFNPFMNVFTDGKVMNGHNDIWTDGVLDFLNEIIRVSAD